MPMVVGLPLILVPCVFVIVTACTFLFVLWDQFSKNFFLTFQTFALGVILCVGITIKLRLQLV